ILFIFIEEIKTHKALAPFQTYPNGDDPLIIINDNDSANTSQFNLQSDPIIDEESLEQIHSNYIASSHELYDCNLSLQQALAKKHDAIVNLILLQEYRTLMIKKEQLEKLRDDIVKRMQEDSL
ncbi:hypothetical protein DICVIV_03261, partial [Dictyocaulus viviparus]